MAEPALSQINACDSEHPPLWLAIWGLNCKSLLVFLFLQLPEVCGFVALDQ